MKRINKKIIVLVLVIGFVLLSIFILAAKTSLSDSQYTSLCNELAKADLDYSTCEIDSTVDGAAVIKIYGIDKDEQVNYVYGYAAVGSYAIKGNTARNLEGGDFPVKLKVRYIDDTVEIIKMYGDGVSSSSVIEEFPLKYRIINEIHMALSPNGAQDLYLEIEQIIEDRWNVHVEE